MTYLVFFALLPSVSDPALFSLDTYQEFNWWASYPQGERLTFTDATCEVTLKEAYSVHMFYSRTHRTMSRKKSSGTELPEQIKARAYRAYLCIHWPHLKLTLRELCLWLTLSWCTDGLAVDQSQTGYQESPQTYQNLVPQTGQFSPAVEGSHSPFLTGTGSNSVQSKTFHSWVKTKHFSSDLIFVVQCVILLFGAGETDQSYFDSDAQRQSSSFWSEYQSPNFAAPPSHPSMASCPSNPGLQSSEQYCPRVVKRKNTPPQRLDREGQMTGMSAYPG